MSGRTLGLADVLKRGRLTGRATGTFPPDGMKVPPSLKLRRRLRANRRCGCVTSVHKGVFCCTSRYTTVLYSPVVMETSTCPRPPGETDPGRKSGHLVFTFSLGRHSFQTLVRRRVDGGRGRNGGLKEAGSENRGSPPLFLCGWGRGDNLLPSNSGSRAL